MTKQRILELSAWGGPLALVVTLVGWLVAGMLPLPISPSAPTSEVVAFYTDDPNRVMAGFVIASIGVVLMLPMLALVSLHLLRIEGRLPLLAFLQLVTAAVTCAINFFPQLLFALTGFRPDRSTDVVLLLNDAAWLLLFTGIAPFMIQNVAIGLAILTDDSGVFPRWVAFVNFLVAFAFVPDVLAFFFKSGPFAWNGVLVFWLALTAYAVFLVTMCVATRRANAQLFAPDRATATA